MPRFIAGHQRVGEIHGQQMEYDEERDKTLAKHGITILRIQNEELNDMESVLRKIETACKNNLNY